MLAKAIAIVLAASVALAVAAAPPTAPPRGVPSSSDAAAAASRDTATADDVIVVLDDGADPLAVAAEMGVTVTHVYRNLFTGFSGTLPAPAMAAARSVPSVRTIFEDGRVHAEGQTVPTGVERIGTPLQPDGQHLAIPSPIDAGIAILDTGVSPVPDLTIAGGISCIGAKASPAKTNKGKKKSRHGKQRKRGGRHHGKRRSKSKSRPQGGVPAWADNNGHGTHTAGIAAAIDNDQGVVGVAPGARIWAVKVLDAKGNGTFSDIICGLDWVVKHKSAIDVVNLSLSGQGSEKTCQTSVLHRAICQTVAAGIPVVVAAGNQGVDARTRVPASYNEVITVSAIADSDGKPGHAGPPTCLGHADDTVAPFANFGAAVDIAAPGECILSLFPDGSTRVQSGTSESTPVVTGAIARYVASYRAAHGVRPTPAQSRTWLLTKASRPQDSAQGFSGDPDEHHEPVLWLNGDS
jgi:subtilisin